MKIGIVWKWRLRRARRRNQEDRKRGSVAKGKTPIPITRSRQNSCAQTYLDFRHISPLSPRQSLSSREGHVEIILIAHGDYIAIVIPHSTTKPTLQMELIPHTIGEVDEIDCRTQQDESRIFRYMDLDSNLSTVFPVNVKSHA